jgi:hypothetical protein
MLLLTAAAAQTVPLPDISDISQGQYSEVIAVQVMSVQNNSRVAVTCAIKWNGSGWGSWFTIPSGGEWSDTALFGGAKLQCIPPVRHLVYRLKRGTRYSLLPSSKGRIELVEVTTRP